jgi:predicted Zn-dependent protease
MTIFGGGSGYQRQGYGGGGFWRLLIGIIIAAIGIITYLARTEVNPVTGEKQHVAISVDDEKRLGLEAAPEMAQQMGGALDPNRDPRAALVRDLGRRIVEQSDAARSRYADNFHYYLLDDPQTVNAFALPGGQVFITSGLFDKLQNEAQLAGVLGHETGHVIGRHAAEHMAKGQLGQMLVGAVAVGASDNRGRGQLAAIAAAMANQMLQLRYSRGDELEADALGMRYMIQSGYDPSEMRNVMEILKRAAGGGGGGGRGPSILQTHPDPDARIAQIDEFLRKYYPNGVPAELTKGRPLR